MNYFSLTKRALDYFGPTLHIQVRSADKLSELIDLAAPGDELHKLPDGIEGDSARISEWVRTHRGEIV